MKKLKETGIFLPLFSLPNKYGIGSMGKEAYKFCDFLNQTKQSYWQILPLGPTSFGDSPYQSLSSFGGSIYYIDLDLLVDDELLFTYEVKEYEHNTKKIDYGYLFNTRNVILKKAYKRFKTQKQNEFLHFLKVNYYWLLDYAIYMFLKEKNNYSSFLDWSEEEKKLTNSTKEKIIKEHIDELNYHFFTQYIFFKQLKNLKDYANSKGIRIIGDMSMYVSLDSVDVWANPTLFLLDEDYVPKRVSGVPPDYFSKTGQLWGNPIYDYEEHEKTNYDWFIKRIMHHLKMYDIIRLDHFRGYASYYSIPNGSVDATIGKWMEGPKMDLFNPLKKKIKEELNKDLNEVIIAEDLGTLTIDVYELLKKTKLTGMKVLQFGLPDVTSIHMPNNYTYNTIAYIGTHDNDTFMGWFESLEIEKQIEILSFLKCSRKTLMEEVIKLMFNSKARIVIINLTDYLHLSTRARINLPGSIINNWSFKFKQIDYEYLRNYIFENFFDKRL